MRQLLGRDDELAAISVAADAGRSVVIHGGTGMGKSVLLRAAGEALESQDRRVVRIVATTTMQRIPLGALAGVLATAGSGAPAEQLVAALQALRAGAKRPPMITVDDAHLLDDHTAGVMLAAAVQSIATIVMTVRSREPATDAVMRFWKDDLADVLTLEPLAETESIELVEGMLAAPVDALTHTQLHEASGGNPLALEELVDAGLRDGRFVDVGGVCSWRGPVHAGPALSQLLHRRFELLSTRARAGAELLAVGGPMPLDLAAAVAGRDALAAAIAEQVVRSIDLPRGTTVELVHPLYGSVLADDLDPSQSRSLLDALVSEAMGRSRRDPELDARTAAWLVQLGDRSRPAVMLAAAKRAFDHSDLGLASHLARAAADAGAAAPAELLLHRIAAIVGRDDPPEPPAVDQAAVESTAMAVHDRFALGMAPAAEALAALAHAMVELEVPGLKAEMLALQLLVRAHAGDVVARVAEEAEMLWTVDSGAKARVRLALAMGPPLVSLGRPDDAVEVLRAGIESARLLEGSEFLTEQLWSSLIHALAFSGRITEAAALASERLGQAQRENRAVVAVAAALPLGLLDLWRGRPRSALRHLGLAVAGMGGLDLVGYLSYGHAHIAWARAWVGEDTGFPPGDGDGDGPRLPSPGYSGAMLAAVTLTAAAERDVLLGRLSLADSGARSAAEFAHNCGQHLLEAFALHCASRVRPSKTTAARISELTAPCQGVLASLLARSAHASATDVPGELERVASDCAELGLLPLACEQLDRASGAYERQGQRSAARRCRSTAVEFAHAMEVALRPTGASGGAAPTRLTTREREVARLAATHTNSEIAATLGTSVRTVHTHLQSAYRKLGVNRRDQLSELLGG